MRKMLIEKISTIKVSHYVVNFFKTSLTVFILSILLFTFTYLLPRTEVVKAKEATWDPPKGESIIEVHIANNGLAFLKGARVESVLENTIIVSTTWKEIKLIWTVNTNGSDYGKRHFGTDYLDSKGNRIKIEDIRVGEVILVSGIFDVNKPTPTIKADVIRTSY